MAGSHTRALQLVANVRVRTGRDCGYGVAQGWMVP
jgi:hypothetical protein